MKVFQLEDVGGLHEIFRDQDFQVFINDVFLLIAQVLELAEDQVDFRLGKIIADGLEAVPQGVTAGVLAQNKRAAGHAHGFRPHDFIGHGVFQHAVLMNAGFMGKGIGADNGLVGLDDHTRQQADQSAGGIDQRGVDVGVQGQAVVPGAHGHDDLFHGGVAGPFTDAVNGHLGLPGAGRQGGQGIGRGQPQVVVTMDADDRPVAVGGVRFNVFDQLREFVRYGIPHRIGNIDGRGAGFNDGLEDFAEKIPVAAGGVFGRELDAVGQ